MRLPLYVVATLVTVGWVVPLLLALTWTSTGSELLARGELARNSFPYFAAARQAACITGLWVSLVGVIWASVLYFRRAA